MLVLQEDVMLFREEAGRSGDKCPGMETELLVTGFNLLWVSSFLRLGGPVCLKTPLQNKIHEHIQVWGSTYCWSGKMSLLPNQKAWRLMLWICELAVKALGFYKNRLQTFMLKNKVVGNNSLWFVVAQTQTNTDFVFYLENMLSWILQYFQNPDCQVSFFWT